MIAKTSPAGETIGEDTEGIDDCGELNGPQQAPAVGPAPAHLAVRESADEVEATEAQAVIAETV